MRNYFLGRPFFYYLNRAEGNANDTLEKHYSPAQCKNGFVVRYSGMDKTNTYKKSGYFLFNDHLDFLNFFSRVPRHQRNFFEVLSLKAQKPHFDVDMSAEDFQRYGTKERTIDEEFELTISMLVSAMIEVFSQYNLKLDVEKNVVLCTSHGENKRSGHVTIHGYSVMNYIEAEAFYILVKNHMPTFTHRWLDNSVYKSTQNWRIVGCQKSGTTRTKIFQNKWKFFHDGWKTIEFKEETEYKVNPTIYRFEVTLLQSFVSQILPSFVERAGDISPDIMRSSLQYENGSYTTEREPGDDETLNKVKQLIMDKLGFTNFPFTVLNNYKYTIVLKKRIPYTCPVCQVIHQNQNPYCYISKGNVWLNCRRSRDHTPDGKSRSTFLGRVYDVDEEENREDENDEEDELGFLEKQNQNIEIKKEEENEGEKVNVIKPTMKKNMDYHRLRVEQKKETIKPAFDLSRIKNY